jgi:Ca-activated chloride channel family protein
MKQEIIILSLLSLILSGCAPQTVIKTDPPQAEVYFNDKYLGKSPVLLDEGVKEDFTVSARKGECQGTKTIHLEKKQVVEQVFSKAKDTAKETIAKLKGERLLPQEILLPLQCALIKTDPPEGEVYLNKKLLGKSPVSLKEEIKEGDILSASNEEYRFSKTFTREEKQKLVDRIPPVPQGHSLEPSISLQQEIILPLNGQIEIGSLRTGVQEEREDLEKYRQVLYKLKNPAHFLVIYDASGSMRWNMAEREATPRFEPAQKAITEFIEKANPEDLFGLIVFGHRVPSGPLGSRQRTLSCKDIELVSPFQRLDKNRMIQAITRLHLKDHKGDTPLEEAIRVGIEALKEKKGVKQILVVTDGDDECGGSPDRAAKEAAKFGIKVNILAYGIGVDKDGRLRTKKEAEIQKTLKECAVAGKGLFFNTKGAEDLYRAMIKVELSSFTYTIKDAFGKELLEGNLGQKFFLDSGSYEISFNTDKPFNAQVDVKPAKNTKILITLTRDKIPEIQTLYE